MKISMLSIFIGLVGVFIILASTVRWFFIYPDPSQLAMAVGIGGIICGFAYIHAWMRQHDIALEDQKNFFNSRYDTLYDDLEDLRKEVRSK